MAIPLDPTQVDRDRSTIITPIQGTVVKVTNNQTNTATTATQVTGLTDTFNIQPYTTYLEVQLVGDSVSNSGANNVIITLWNGVVGSGTQVGQSSATAQSGALAPLASTFYVPITPSLWNTSITLNIGMHGSGAGTNTISASTTAPLFLVVKAL